MFRVTLSSLLDNAVPIMHGRELQYLRPALIADPIESRQDEPLSFEEDWLGFFKAMFLQGFISALWA